MQFSSRRRRPSAPSPDPVSARSERGSDQPARAALERVPNPPSRRDQPDLVRAAGPPDDPPPAAPNGCRRFFRFATLSGATSRWTTGRGRSGTTGRCPAATYVVFADPPKMGAIEEQTLRQSIPAKPSKACFDLEEYSGTYTNCPLGLVQCAFYASRNGQERRRRAPSWVRGWWDVGGVDRGSASV